MFSKSHQKKRNNAKEFSHFGKQTDDIPKICRKKFKKKTQIFHINDVSKIKKKRFLSRKQHIRFAKHFFGTIIIVKVV